MGPRRRHKLHPYVHAFRGARNFVHGRQIAEIELLTTTHIHNESHLNLFALKDIIL